MSAVVSRYSVAWLSHLTRPTVTTAEAARLLNTTPRTVIALVKLGQLDGWKLGGRWHIRRSSLLGLIDP